MSQQKNDFIILNKKLKELLIKCPQVLFQYVLKLNIIEKNLPPNKDYFFVIHPKTNHAYDARKGRVDCDYLAKFLAEEYRFFDIYDPNFSTKPRR